MHWGKASFFGLLTATVILSSGCASSVENVEELRPLSESPSQENISPATDPEPESAEVSYELARDLLDDEICKLKEDSQPRRSFTDAYAVSFPVNPLQIKPEGEVNITVIPVDWVDVQGEGAPSAYVGDQLDTLEAFYRTVSEENLSLSVDLQDQWFRLMGNSSDYYITEAEESDWRPPAPEKREKLFGSAIESADPVVDFSNTDVVLLILPKNADVLEVGALSFLTQRDAKTTVSADGNTIVHFLAGGNRFDKRPQTNLWSFWAHEFGHMLGLPDMVLHGNIQGVEMWEVNPFSGYDIMAQQDGPLRTINSWTRWVNGWIPDDAVFCTSSETVNRHVFALAPLDDLGSEFGRSLVIKISEDEVVVVENRSPNRQFDTPVDDEWYGIVSYLVSRKLGHGEAAFRLLTHVEGKQSMKYTDDKTNLNSYLLYGTMSEGDEYSYEGIKIKVLDFQGTTGIVEVSTLDD
jgi:M6 family metalloprotease-like protein